MIKKLFTLSVSFFLFFFSLLTTVFANQTAIRVELYNIESGLTQTGVQCLLLDSYGFIWVGTQDGLNRFDGYNFKIFRNHPLDSATISNNYINSLCEDRDGNIWVGTSNGLSLYNRKTGSFQNFYHSPSDANSLSNDRIFCIFQDRSGVIWIKTAESLEKYNPSVNGFIRYPHYSDVFSFSSENNDFDIFEDSQSKLWVGTKDGLMMFDRNLGLFKRYSYNPSIINSISNNRIKDIFEDSNGNLWIATSHGLNLYQPKSDSFIRFVNDPSNPKSLPHNLVNTIFQDSRGTLWLGTNQGFCSFDPVNRTFLTYSMNSKENELSSSTITSFVEDNSNILWIGTLMGLVKWDSNAQKFNLYSKYPDGTNMFSGNSIASLFEDKHGIVWLGTWGNGLHLFDRARNQVVKYSERFQGNNICNDYVHAIYGTTKNEILIGTRNGVQQYLPEKKSFTDFFMKHWYDASRTFSDNRVYDILEDSKGNFWFATRLGLHRFDRETMVSFYNHPNDSNTLSSSEIHAIALDKDDYIWVGTFNGLNRLNLKTLEITRYNRPTLYTKGQLISNEILSLLVASNGIVWIGTSSGLHSFNPQNNFFTLYTESDGLPNNLIYCIQEDNKGNIWVSTNWGIAVLNTTTQSVVSYGLKDGLQSYEFNLGSSFKSSKGELFFGGVSGFNTFFPDSLRFNNKIPKIVITSFELISAAGREDIPAQGNEVIVINDDFSLINIEFSALDFTRPEKNIYKYKMEGLDNEWLELGHKRFVTFSNLKEGVYQFQVKGANSDGLWNEEGVSLKIIVKTKLWKTKIAYGVYVVIFILSIILFLRTRTKMLRKTSRLLKERESTMKEMEKQKEELLLINKNITDSINYAKRIQEALIPTEQHFRSIMPDTFILYLPKDIVSGDFYWINETQNKIFVAVVDCTGHGVPGAFMSIIGIELLRNITNVMGLNDAAEILNRLDKGVHDTFVKGVGEHMSNVKDGMDVSFCVIDKENNTLQFAGAFSNLYLIRDSNLIEVKGDRHSVGVSGEIENPLFNSHFIPVEPDDMIYLFTDGYVDQFGGPEGKKYKFRRFRHLLLSIHKLPLEEQKAHIRESIKDWRGEHEQVDDILIIGIKTDLSCFF